jgi:hypothetical protein
VVPVETHQRIGPKFFANIMMRVDVGASRAGWRCAMRKVLHLCPHCLLPEEICR